MVNLTLIQVLESLYETAGQDKALADLIVGHCLETGFMTPEDVQAARDAMAAYDATQEPINLQQILAERSTVIPALRQEYEAMKVQLATITEHLAIRDGFVSAPAVVQDGTKAPGEQQTR